MKYSLTAFCAAIALIHASAAIPSGYYSSLDGKKASALADAAAALADGHAVISYNSQTWSAFEKTDVRTIDGRQCWWDK